MMHWAVAARPIAGEVVSGDAHLVAEHEGGALLAVIDGLGHGPEAERSAHAAVEVLARAPARPLERLVVDCHEALGRLRGAMMTWLGVGNVEGLFVPAPSSNARRRERLFVWGGVIGQSLPSLRPASLPLRAGDVLVLATDGIRSDFADRHGIISGTVDAIANRILAEHATGRDDALVLVARYGGSS
jgi:negative regulator of sigma-B (phosphoserine phosphatase)